MNDRNAGLRRKIYFYRIGDKNEYLKFLPGEIARIGNLPFEPGGRYHLDGDGNRYTAWPASYEYPLKIKFGKTRLSNLPTRELVGKLETLELKEDEGLAETCHTIIYENGFVASEFNFEGPRIGRLGEYLYALGDEISGVPKFLPLFQKDILELVLSMPVVNLLQLKGKPHAQHVLREADEDLAQTYAAMTKLGADKIVGLELSARNNPHSVLRILVSKIASVVASNPGEIRDSMSILKIKGLTVDGNISEVDLLEDKLIASTIIERGSEKGKALSSDDAFEKIDSAYWDRYNQIVDAVEGRTFY